MALKYQKQKNLVRSPDEYTRYYGDFRGVDFSSDHTEVHEQRLAYAINMYKDYRTGEGNAIETVPGFRRRFEAPRSVDPQGKVEWDAINGIHEFEYIKSDGTRDKDILVHAGNYLYLWDNYPSSVNVLLQKTLTIPDDSFELNIDFECDTIKTLHIEGSEFPVGFTFDKTDTDNKTLTLDDSFALKDENGDLVLDDDGKKQCKYAGSSVNIDYYEKVTTRGFKDEFQNGFEDEFCRTINTSEQELSDAPSKSFVFDNRLFIIDGTNYYVYYKSSETTDTFTFERVTSSELTYIPTVYRNLTLGEIAPTDMRNFEYEQKNLLSQYFNHTYIAGKDEKGWIDTYPLYVDISGDTPYSVADVYLNGSEKPLTLNTDYKVEIDDNKNCFIKFTPAPEIPANKPEDYAGVMVRYKKSDTLATADKNRICKCTVVATFDKRVFVTGNPEYPNNIYFCGYNNNNGREDATYFGELDTVVDGVENAPITGLIAVADTLAAIKNHARQDGSVYFHTRLETNASVIPVTYPSQQGLSGIGCLGACVNFLDDPVFISRLGVEAIGQLSVRLERAIEHRSSLIDAKLVNLPNLEKAQFAEWDGYLVLLVDGKIFLADSRQRYTHQTGVMQYEWYYLEGIGVYEGQEDEYYYSANKYTYIPDQITVDEVPYDTDIASHLYNAEIMTSENRLYTPVDLEEYEDGTNELIYMTHVVKYDENGDLLVDENGNPLPEIYEARYVIRQTWDGETYNADGQPKVEFKAILCEYLGSKTGGNFYEATKVVNIGDENVDNIFFGTGNGIVCSFNFDKKNPDGTISPIYYTFDDRTIYCGIATKMDNCGVPHLSKSTIKKSTVIKTKSMIKSAAKVRVRTNNKGYTSVARVNSRVFSFDNIDFSDFSFVSTDQTIFAIKEKEKHWVEKQHWIYSDEFRSPFSVHYLAFRYKISGRIKGQS